MAFIRRVGMEPANDLKKRIRSLCEEAGFVVSRSLIHMLRKEQLKQSFRILLTSVREKDWNPSVVEGREDFRDEQISLMARIGCDGTYGGLVELRCMATDRAGDIFCPALRGCVVSVADIPLWLPVIAAQMHQVLASRGRGENGPWRFDAGNLHWETVDLFKSGS